MEKDPLEIYTDGENIILTKYAANMACLMTGDITTKNKTYAGGKIVLSPRGAEMLLEDMMAALSKRNKCDYIFRRKGSRAALFFVYLIPALGKNKKSCSKRS